MYIRWVQSKQENLQFMVCLAAMPDFLRRMEYRSSVGLMARMQPIH